MSRSVTDFGGRAGAMLSRTTSILAVFTGLVLVAAVLAVVFLSQYSPHELIPAVALQFLMSFFVAHFAVEGYAEEWDNAGRRIPAGKVAVVALRYMALSLLLLIPLAFVSPPRDAGLAAVTMPTMNAVLTLLYALLLVIAPPALLVVAVSASSWGNLVSPSHWASRFGGRGGDFFLIYVVFVGALVVVVLAGLPIVALAGLSSAKATMLTAAGLAVFAMGFSISLMGRLCGSFAVVEEEEPAAEKPAPTHHPALHPALARFEHGATEHAAPEAEPADAPAGTGRKTVLLDAAAKVEELRAKHAGDATALAAALGELDEGFLPHPAVRQALVTTLVSAGRYPEAVAMAREAIPLCMRSGNLGGAALMCEALLEAGDSLGLSKEQLLSIGDTLRGMKHSVEAVDVYAHVLRMDPTDVKAMKGTIAVAQELSHQKETAGIAVRVYDALITTCPGSPLIDFVRTEREKASKKAEGI